MSTHNLDEAERIADRVAVLHERLVAIDRPDELRGRLTTGRLIIRLAADAAPYVDTLRRVVGGAEVVADRAMLVVHVAHADRQTPAIVAALVDANAQVLEVRPEIPALEDVYLHLMGEGS